MAHTDLIELVGPSDSQRMRLLVTVEQSFGGSTSKSVFNKGTEVHATSATANAVLLMQFWGCNELTLTDSANPGGFTKYTIKED
jgi:hypothetical protein